MAIVALGTATAIATGIKTLADAIDALSTPRSVILVLENHTDLTLIRHSHSHSHGGWEETPATQIPPKSAMLCSSKDIGLFTGTQGTLVYRHNNASIGWDCRWNNPHIGGNSCGSLLFGMVNSPFDPLRLRLPTYSFHYSHVCGSGNQKAQMRYTLLAFDRQTNWRWCKKCFGLWFAGYSQSRCPQDGGNHTKDGSGNYSLVQNSDLAPGQDRWRWCHKCSGLWFSGHPTSVCAHGGEHAMTGSGNYKLVHNDVLAPGQNNWRYCKKCRGLWYGGTGTAQNESDCPAGGRHSASGSGNYTLLEV